MQVVLEQEVAVRHDVGGDEGAGEDWKTEGTGVGGGAGGDRVADEDGGEGVRNGGTDFEMVERVERMLTLGVARLLERLDWLEESFEDEDAEKGAEEKKVEKPEKETEETVRGSDEEMEGSEESLGSGSEESEEEEGNGGNVEME